MMSEHENDDGRQFQAEITPPIAHESYFGGEVQVIEAIPIDSKTEQPIATNEPDIYYAHGAGWAQEEPTITEMARRGRKAFSMEAVGDRIADARFVVGHREPGNVESLQHLEKKEVAARLGKLSMIVPKQQMREAATLLALITERGEQHPAAGRIDAVFQSESAGHGLIAVYTEPDRFENVVLAFPGSLSGPQTGFIPGRIIKDGMVRRQHRPLPDGDFRRQAGASAAEALRMQLKSPGFKEDAAALRYSALAQMLHSIRERENTPGVTLVAGLDDKIFALEGYLESLVAPTDLDAIIVVPGGHAIGGRREVLATIMEQFPAMRALKAAREQARREGQAPIVAPLRNRILLPKDTPLQRAERIMALADAADRRTVHRRVN
jgi:hypothetical protein